MKILGLLMAAALLCAGIDNRAHADTIVYTEEGLASGSLGGSAFTNSDVLITLTGDTSNIVNPAPGYFNNSIGTATVNISGLGSATFTDQMGAYDKQMQPGSGGIGDANTTLVLLFDYNPAFQSYAMDGSIGPLSGSSEYNAGFVFRTTAGNFILTESTTAAFTAVEGSTAAAPSTPEPGSFMMLLALGIIGGGLLSKRRCMQSIKVAPSLVSETPPMLF